MVDVAEWVRWALENAMGGPDPAGPRGIIHADRSRRFVEALGAWARLRVTSPDDRVLTKHHAAHRREFGVSELLFDVLWCTSGPTPAAEASVMLRHVVRAKWVVESEFARNSREALFDFNKLVLADADDKLFVGPSTRRADAFLAPLAAAARHVRGRVHVALVPHPAEWSTGRAPEIRVFVRRDGGWRDEKWRVADPERN